jgi:hypothetical protein
MTKEKTYHIYLNDKCLFKNLNESEFQVIWSRMYHSYFGEQITYAEIDSDYVDKLAEHSY